MQLVLPRVVFPAAAGAETAGRFVRFLVACPIWLRQAFCALSGHQLTLHFAPDRLSLQCLSCGMETPGWRIDVREKFRIQPRRAVIRTTSTAPVQQAKASTALVLVQASAKTSAHPEAA
jgi:hypothetical protein